MALDILELRKLCIPKNIRITLHAAKRLEQRRIFLKDVIACIMNGEIIEQYPDDYPYPSCLILGMSIEDKYLHVVIGNHESDLFLITAYFPSFDKWESDFKTRTILRFCVLCLTYSPAQSSRSYSVENRDVIESNARRLNIPITVFETDIFNSVYNVDKYPCYLCARMRRGYLYKKAKQLGCNKIALGHHYDDVIETILMGMLYGGQVQTMMPKLHSTNYEGMELIRPLYLVREAEIKHWRDYNKLNFIQCACRFTDTCTTCSPNSNTGSKRQEIKQLIANLKKINPQIESNIFHSVENVNLDTIISYKQGDNKVSFLDRYDDMVPPISQMQV